MRKKKPADCNRNKSRNNFHKITAPPGREKQRGAWTAQALQQIKWNIFPILRNLVSAKGDVWKFIFEMKKIPVTSVTHRAGEESNSTSLMFFSVCGMPGIPKRVTFQHLAGWSSAGTDDAGGDQRSWGFPWHHSTLVLPPSRQRLSMSCNKIDLKKKALATTSHDREHKKTGGTPTHKYSHKGGKK